MPSSFQGVKNGTTITWTWTDKSSNETGFKIYGSTNPAGPFNLITGSIGAGSNSYAETGLTTSATYYRYVVAYNPGGYVASIPASVNATYPPPTGTPTTPSAGGGSSSNLAFTWTQGSASDSVGITSYYLQVGTCPASDDASLFSQDVGNVLTYAIPNAVDGKTYYAHVMAKNGTGGHTQYSAWSVGVTVAVVNPAASTTFQTADGVKLDFPAGALASAARVLISTPASHVSPPKQAGFAETSIVREFALSDGTRQFLHPVTVTFPYLSADIAGINASTLRMFYFNDATNSWTLIPGSTVDTLGRKVSASVTHFTIFAVFGFSAASGDASNYPNPFSPLRGEKTKIRYVLDSDQSVTVTIYSPFGRKVSQQSFSAGAAGGQQGPNEVQWDGKTDNGRFVGMGGYLCVIDANGSRKTIKVGVK